MNEENDVKALISALNEQTSILADTFMKNTHRLCKSVDEMTKTMNETNKSREEERTKGFKLFVKSICFVVITFIISFVGFLCFMSVV